MNEYYEPQPVLSPETVKVGDGVTEGVGSDRYAGTVTWVSESGKTIRFTHDNYKAKPGSDYYGHQDYEYESVEPQTGVNPMGESFTNERQARWSEKRKGFVTFGRTLSAGRHTYFDPHF